MHVADLLKFDTTAGYSLKFITLLTFELSSFRENGCLFYCIFRAVAADTSCWTPKSTRRQNRENGHTDTPTQNSYCNLAAHVRRGLMTDSDSSESELVNFVP